MIKTIPKKQKYHWDDPEGWYEEGGGRGVQDGEHIYTRGGFMLMPRRSHDEMAGGAQSR